MRPIQIHSGDYHDTYRVRGDENVLATTLQRPVRLRSNSLCALRAISFSVCSMRNHDFGSPRVRQYITIWGLLSRGDVPRSRLPSTYKRRHDRPRQRQFRSALKPSNRVSSELPTRHRSLQWDIGAHNKWFQLLPEDVRRSSKSYVPS